MRRNNMPYYLTIFVMIFIIVGLVFFFKYIEIHSVDNMAHECYELNSNSYHCYLFGLISYPKESVGMATCVCFNCPQSIYHPEKCDVIFKEINLTKNKWYKLYSKFKIKL